MKGISFNTWVYGSFPSWLPAYTLDETIRRIASHGYDGIEIGCASPHAWPDYLSPERRKEVLQLLKKENLRVAAMLPAPGGGPGMNPASPIAEERAFTIQHYKDVVRLAHDWECPTVMWIAGWVVHGTAQREAWKHSVEGLGDVARYAKELGVAMVIEPTSADSNLVDTADDAIEMSEEVGEANVKLMFDTYHALYRNEVASDYVYRMKDKLHHVHIADSDRLPPGMGRCHFPSVLKALQEIGYPGYLSLEVGFHTRQADPDWYAETSIRYLREQLKILNETG